MVARTIRYQVKGFRPQTLLTSMTDPEQYPGVEVAALYHERWEIEDKARALYNKGMQARLAGDRRALERAANLLVLRHPKTLYARRLSVELTSADRASRLLLRHHIARMVADSIKVTRRSPGPESPGQDPAATPTK